MTETDHSISFNVQSIREDFPILSTMVYDKPLVYFDNAATTHKPRRVIEAIESFYTNSNSNVHRGVHLLSQHATNLYENARAVVKNYIHAASLEEIIFTRGTTEGINLVAHSFAARFLQPGDEIILSGMEHHSNIVPWQLAAERYGLLIKVIPIKDNGELDFDAYKQLLTPKTKLVGIVHISNALGTINPVREMISLAHECGAKVLVDGAQAIAHTQVDVQALDCDFYVFSGHKLYAPTGIGVLYGKKELLNAMPPYQGGGDMILSVSFEKTVYNELPAKFEAGTPHIAGAIGLASAIEYLSELGLEPVAAYEQELLDYATQLIAGIDEVRIIGQAPQKASVLSFTLKDIHPHDVGSLLDREGIAIRAGHHCAQPVMKRFGVPATNRASFAFYNTTEEIDHLAEALKKIILLFR